MASLSAAIMAHPSRGAFVEELRDQLDREIPVSWDVEGPPSPDKEKRWRVGSAAWRMHGYSDWHMVIQDDTTVCGDLLAGLEKALDYVPDEIGLVQPYVGKNRPLGQHFVALAGQAERAGATWIQHRSLCWGVAIIARTATIENMIGWCSKRVSLTYDSRVGRYYRDALGQHTWYTWPSLVDHRNGPSLVGHGPGRVAHKPHLGSALELAWDGPVIRDRVPIRPGRQHPMRPTRPITRRPV
jgi:hypothetical protein